MGSHRKEDTNGHAEWTCRYFEEADTERTQAIVSAIEHIDETLKTQLEKMIDKAIGRDAIPLKTHYMILLTTISILAGTQVIGILIAFLK